MVGKFWSNSCRSSGNKSAIHSGCDSGGPLTVPYWSWLKSHYHKRGKDFQVALWERVPTSSYISNEYQKKVFTWDVVPYPVRICTTRLSRLASKVYSMGVT